jgi:hypothetical protein
MDLHPYQCDGKQGILPTRMQSIGVQAGQVDVLEEWDAEDMEWWVAWLQVAEGKRAR